jgi:hypothetical protein
MIWELMYLVCFFFDTIEIMKDLEIARYALDKSKESPIPNPNSMVHVDEMIPKEDVPLLEWLENDSEYEQFTVVQPKKKKNLKSQSLLEDSAKGVPIRRSKRTTPSMYRGRGGQEGSAPMVKQYNKNDITYQGDLLEL